MATSKSKRHQREVLGVDKDEKELRETALSVFGCDADLDFASEISTKRIADSGFSSADSSHENSSEEFEESEDEDKQVDLSIPEKTSKKPAWVDKNDSKIKVSDVTSQYSKFRGKRGFREISDEVYEDTLRKKFVNVIGGQPQWADLDSVNKQNSDEDDDDDITKHTGTYLMGKRTSLTLPKTKLEFKKMKDLNYTSYSEGNIIKCAEFNPNPDNVPIALVAGTTGKHFGTASLFQVDGVNNHKIHTVKFEKFPIRCGHFTMDGQKFIVGSNLYGHFFVYDTAVSKSIKIPWNKSESRRSMKYFKLSPDGHLLVFAGNSGELHIFDATAFSHITTLQGPSQVNAITFNADGSRMYTHGESGEVFIWDMNTRSCIHKFYDEGCIEGISIAMAPNSKYLACGSSSGIVNVYETNKILSEFNPTPTKSISNLTTAITDLKFNSTSEILAMTSDLKNNSMKMVHFPSMQTFSNFPNLQKDMRRCQTVDFSPNSGYLSIGNNSGCAYLFRLKHFKSF